MDGVVEFARRSGADAAGRRDFRHLGHLCGSGRISCAPNSLPCAGGAGGRPLSALAVGHRASRRPVGPWAGTVMGILAGGTAHGPSLVHGHCSVRTHGRSTESEAPTQPLERADTVDPQVAGFVGQPPSLEPLREGDSPPSLSLPPPHLSPPHALGLDDLANGYARSSGNSVGRVKEVALLSRFWRRRSQLQNVTAPWGGDLIRRRRNTS
ncbi:hypothetical protein ACSSS7_004656 [Eimeria intestinalis]